MSRGVVVMELPGKKFTFTAEVADCFEFVERFARDARVQPLDGSFRAAPQRRESRRRGENSISVREMKAAITKAQPTSDAERVGVIVAVAERHEQAPVDISFVREWFGRAGLREPAAMSATVSNARKTGYIRSVAHGQFEPTPLALALIGDLPENVVEMPRRAG